MILGKLTDKLNDFTIADDLKKAGVYPYFRPIEEKA